MGCFYACCDRNAGSGLGTRVWNLTERPIDLQIRVGSMLRKSHTLKPGKSKKLGGKIIYKAYMPRAAMNDSFYYDDKCKPYVWVQDHGADFSRMVKQQYISLEDLRDYSEIRICRDQSKGSISVLKKPRPDFC